MRALRLAGRAALVAGAALLFVALVLDAPPRRSR